MRPVVTAEARVLQVRQARAGSTVGYGATVTLARDTTLATVATGYADGYHRAARFAVSLRELLRDPPHKGEGGRAASRHASPPTYTRS
jgi:alanine racemase